MSTPEFYANAKAYDIAFGDRDFVDECNFLEYALRTFGGLAFVSPSFLELAAGPAQHAREFARRGWRAVALDLSQDMLDYARAGAAQDGVTIETACADMTDFTLTEPVALVANLMESLSHLTTNDQIVAHFQAVGRNLLPGGIFVIEMAHPETIWRDSLPNFWTSKHPDGTEVDILFGAQDDPYDWVTQQWTVTTRLNIREPNLAERVVESHNNHRWYLAQELRALIDLSGAFSQQWWFGNMTVPPPDLDSGPASDRMIVVLRK